MVIVRYATVVLLLCFCRMYALELPGDDPSVEEHLKQSKTPLSAPSQLVLSGVLQSDWTHYYTNLKRSQKRTHHTKFHNVNESYVQLDLMLDYRNDRSAASLQLEFEEPTGIQNSSTCSSKTCSRNILRGSGSGDWISLVKAYINYRLINESANTLIVEIGRRYMSDLFESTIQFDSQFDGVSLQYSSIQGALGDSACTLGAFVIDETSNHFGYVAAYDQYNIKNSNIDITYSLISWDKHGANSYGKRHPEGCRFTNSQILTRYHLPQNRLLYAAFLHNHAATRTWRTNRSKQANAAYAGFTLGQVAKKNDYSFDCNYQWVQAQAITEFDVAGIGRYNPKSISFYNTTRAGFANYKGFAATLIYALTDALNLQFIVQHARPANARIGGNWKMWTFECTTIYSF